MGDIVILLFCAEKQFLGIYLENMKSPYKSFGLSARLENIFWALGFRLWASELAVCQRIWASDFLLVFHVHPSHK